MRSPFPSIIHETNSRGFPLTPKGCCVAILAGLVLAIIAIIVKAATGHSIAGLLVLLMILMGVFSLVWDFATRERGR